MIRDDEDLAEELKQLGHIETALESLRKDIFPKNPRNFEILSEGYVEQIDILKAGIDEYVTRKKATLPDAAAAPTTMSHPTSAS